MDRDIPTGTLVGMAASTVADLVGRVLAGRYRLLGSIGSGASGRVYVADDVRLRRRVAVKVLHAALAEDAGFLRRFRSEAQLAASLHHPNVMAVYDWGEDGVPYMVLELLAGGSLRSMLDAGNKLSPAQTAHVGGQVAGALDYAHGRGLVHRDIKPANLLFDEHGIVRVADFGLARALAEASWTEPVGAVVGTARYAAPEQGTGVALDGRADIYALGLVLVEAVTGSVPLVADTALGTVGLRQETTMKVPDAMGPIAPVVQRACRAEPRDRYAAADEMRDELVDIAEQLPPPGPLVLAGLGAVGDDPHPTQVVATAVEALFDQDEGVAVLRRPVPVAARFPQRSRSAAPFMLGAVMAVVLSALAFVLAQPSQGTTTSVPLLVGQTETQAKQLALDRGLLGVSALRPSDDPAGVVIAQKPRAGGFLHEGQTIELLVSKGPKPIPLPELQGKTAEEATGLLEAQFAVELVKDFDDNVPVDQVISSEPKGSAPLDSLVRLHVSRGPRPVVIPDVARGTYDKAVARLKTQVLGAQRVDEFSDTVPAGTVIRTEPAAGDRAPRNSAVRVFVSKGQDLVIVPDFKGTTIEEANVLAAAAGVEVLPDGVVSAKRKVRAQDPPAATSLKRGTVVTIFF